MKLDRLVSKSAPAAIGPYSHGVKRGDMIITSGQIPVDLSLRNDYEVTGPELDTLAQAAWEHPGVLGARMTGAGFGGCTVNLVKNESVDSFIEQVGEKYKKIIGYDADFYVVTTGSGVCRC